MGMDNNLEKFVTMLRDAAGPNLESVILYGSSVAGDFHPEFSNLNVFCVLRDTSFRSLVGLGPATKWWSKRNQPTPLFMTRDELARSTDVFTIELLDMQQHYRVLFGEDVLKDLRIPTRLHRVQVEYELREKLVLLRQGVSVAGGNDSQLWDFMIRSLPSFLTLFRHALVALGEPAPDLKRESVEALSKRIGFQSTAITRVLDIRENKGRRTQFSVQEVFAGYLAAVEQVTTAVDKMLDSAPDKV